MNKILFIFIVFVFCTSASAEDLVIQNISSGCGSDFSYSAIFETNMYDCTVGTYLPAGGTKCLQCPDGYTCSGGTFEFSAINTQGLDYGDIIVDNMFNSCGADFAHSFSTVFEPNVHECAHGEYLPANVDGCTPCLNDNYCPGGTYVFNETVTQGIAPCPDAHPFAPGGMWLESQCGRKLHVADDVLYLHTAPATPSEKRLYVRFGDVIYSANATPVKDTTNPKMSENAERSLHVMIDGVEYVVHDDSVR